LRHSTDLKKYKTNHLGNLSFTVQQYQNFHFEMVDVPATAK